MRDTCISLFNKEQEEKSFKIYVTDCLRIISQNTGQYMTLRWFDCIEQKPQKEIKQGEAKEKICSKLRS